MTQQKPFIPHLGSPMYPVYAQGHEAGVQDTQEKAHQEGYLRCRNEYLPMMLGLLEIVHYYGGSDLEAKVLDEHKALMKRVEGLVK